MKSSYSGTCLFCDDLRIEAGNKASYMGIYGSDLIIPEIPIILPSLCIVTFIIVPIREYPKEGRIFHDIMGEERILDIPKEALLNFQELSLKELESDPDLQQVRISTNIKLFPFQINKASIIRVWAELDGQIVRAGRLKVTISFEEANRAAPGAG
jgi:hypothetical protein